MQRRRGATPRAPHRAARTFAEDLRHRTDEQLSLLLLARPDLARPTPADIVALAARATTRTSVQRALERLDRGQLQTLEALVVAAEPHRGAAATVEDIEALLGADPSDVLEQLWLLGLVWWTSTGAHPVRAITEVLGPHPGGLGIPAAEVAPEYAASAPPASTDLSAVLAEAPAAARAILHTLTWGPPIGAVPPSGPAHNGAAWLVEKGLCAPSGIGHITLVREVALALRGGRVHRDTALLAPELGGTQPGDAQVDPAVADRVAGAAARDLLGLLDQLGDLWTAEPPRVLRSGALGVRDLAGLSRALDVDSAHAAWLAEMALAARLIADDAELTPAFSPTADFDVWRSRSAGARWASVAQAWWESPRAAYLVGSSPNGTAAVGALGPEVRWPPVRGVRADVLGELATVAPGGAPSAESVIERLLWRRPLGDRQALTEAGTAILREAAWLGATALGALTSLGRALVERVPAGDLAVSGDAILPASVDHVLLQADLTAIAPGPLDGALGRFMRLVSDVESRGGAMVLRLSAESVRRALDSGWTADEVLDTLRDSSRTPVPQPLEYLVRDVARRHGQTRVGAATAYIRSDDEAVLAALLADRSLARAVLRRIAPTVLVSQTDPATLVEVLRAGGYSPALESFDGTVVVERPVTRRARPPVVRTVAEPALLPVDAAVVRGVVATLRAAPERPVAGATPPVTLSGSPQETSALLRQAVSDSLAVWIGYADGNGRTARHLVRPVRIDGGRVYAVSGESDAEHLFMLHRITGASAG